MGRIGSALRQAARRSARIARHEWTRAALLSSALSGAMTWPALRDPLRTLPGDTWDPALQSWQMAWSGWAVKHDPGALWHSNAFHPERYGFAFSDTLLGYLPAGLIGSGPTAAVLRYNLVFVFTFALAFFGAYLLARQLGSRPAGAMVAGAAFAYAPWRWTQLYHLQILSTGGMALSLAMLARGHGYSLRHGYRPERARPGWALAGWLVAAWQLSLGFGLGLPFGYVLALLTLAAAVWWLVRRPAFGARLLRSDVVGGCLFVAVSGFMAYPYLRVVERYPYARRSLEEIMFFSPAPKGFLTAPSHSLLWGDAHQSLRVSLVGQGGWEAVMLPGFALYGLAALGLFLTVWSRRHRLLMATGLLVVGTLAMGMRAPVNRFYVYLYKILPGWDGIRTPGRLVVWVTLILALLAAGAVTAAGERLGPWLRDRWGGRRPGAARGALVLGAVLPVALVLVEGVQQAPFPTVPAAPASLATAEGPVLVLPSDWKDDELTMLWSTSNFVPLVNGSPGFQLAGLNRTREITKTFPDRASVAHLRRLGVRTVVVLRHPYAVRLPDPPTGSQVPEHALTAPVDGLGITREERPDVVVFRLDR